MHSKTDNLEIELKFSLQKSDLSLNAVIQCLDGLQIQNLKRVAQPVKKLTNIYFETDDNLLRQHDMGLRIRGVDDRFEMTLKTGAIGSAGVQQRHEYNIELTDNMLDILQFPRSAFPIEWNLMELNVLLKPLFTTNFHRKIWDIEYIDTQCRKTEIEVVFDDGVIFVDGRNESIYEIEMELKNGHSDSLLEFAETFLSIPAIKNSLRLSDLSKAARGYMLFNQIALKAPKSPNLDVSSNSLAWLFYLEECILREQLPVALPVSVLQHSQKLNDEPSESVRPQDLNLTSLFNILNQIYQSLVEDSVHSVLYENINNFGNQKQVKDKILKFDPIRTKQDLYLTFYNQIKLCCIDIHK